MADILDRSADELARLLRELRRATLLVAVERSGLRDLLTSPEGVLSSSVDQTEGHLLTAGEVLGIFQKDSRGRFSWSADYAALCRNGDRWRDLLSLIRHQLSYLNLVDDPKTWQAKEVSPARQLESNPAEYENFLKGVEASHHHHAKWFAEVLRDRRILVDVGGGLGTFSKAWVESSPDRQAILIDLPGVQEFTQGLLTTHDGRIEFVGGDLRDPFNFPGNADLFLLANVIHLIPDWKGLINRVVASAPGGGRVAIFEADPDSPAGALFNLQVHLRSGRTTALVNGREIENAMTDSGLLRVKGIPTVDPEDPFQRTYTLWVGDKAG